MTQMFCSFAALMCLVHAVPGQNATITAKTTNGLIFSSFRCQMGPRLQSNKKNSRMQDKGKGFNVNFAKKKGLIFQFYQLPVQVTPAL